MYTYNYVLLYSQINLTKQFTWQEHTGSAALASSLAWWAWTDWMAFSTLVLTNLRDANIWSNSELLFASNIPVIFPARSFSNVCTIGNSLCSINFFWSRGLTWARIEDASRGLHWNFLWRDVKTLWTDCSVKIFLDRLSSTKHNFLWTDFFLINNNFGPIQKLLGGGCHNLFINIHFTEIWPETTKIYMSSPSQLIGAPENSLRILLHQISYCHNHILKPWRRQKKLKAIRIWCRILNS